MNAVVKLNDWKGWSAVTIGSDLLHLEELYNLSENVFKNKLDAFEKEFELKTKDLSEDAKTSYGDFVSDEYWKLSQVFPQIFRVSILITCMSRLEYHLKDICNSIYQFENKYDEPKKLEQDTIVNCKKYLVKNVKIDSNLFKTEWENILCYKIIRNRLAHNDGFIKESDRLQIERFFSKNKNLGSSKDLKIQLDSLFCIQVINDINIQLLNIDKFMRDKQIKTHLFNAFG